MLPICLTVLLLPVCASVLSAVLAVGAIALFLGFIIVLVFHFFSVETDPREADILAMLPSVNCGGCGYSGCQAYAQAIASGIEQRLVLCAPGGQETAAQIAAYLGEPPADFIPTVAVMHCQGSRDHTQLLYQYDGSPNCATAQGLFAGPNSCRYACLGFGDCVRACEYDAIHIRRGLAQIDADRCVACGQCVKACPRRLISIEAKYQALTVVRCRNPLPALQVRAACDIGCIGCGLCVKKCPVQAIHMEEKLAVIDTGLCTGCGVCVAVCPSKSIVQGFKAEEVLD